jgi:hypothetical protein
MVAMSTEPENSATTTGTPMTCARWAASSLSAV